MNGKAFPVIVVFQSILQGNMLPTDITFKVIYRSPGTRKIFPVCQDQILYIVCGQRLFCILPLYLPAGSRLCTLHINDMPLIHLFRILKINAVPVAVIHSLIDSLKCWHIPVAVTVRLYLLPCAAIHHGNTIAARQSIRSKGDSIIKIRHPSALKA